MSTQTESFTAAETKRFQIPGGYFKLFSCTAEVELRFFMNGQQLKGDGIGVLGGFGVRQEFDSFSVYSASAQSVTWFISDGVIDYDRTVGSVEVVDGERARTVNDTAFMGYSQASGSAGEYGHVQIWNPAASGVNFFSRSLRYWSYNHSGERCGFGRYNTALTFSNYLHSKKTGANGLIEMRYTSNPGLLGSPSDYFPFEAIWKPIEVVAFEPIRLAPGEGFVCWSYAVAKNISQFVEGYIETV